MVGSALALTACAGTEGEADYGYETAAPYADERTVGEEGYKETTKQAPGRAERVFNKEQRK